VDAKKEKEKVKGPCAAWCLLEAIEKKLDILAIERYRYSVKI
jgi:hypothetical protein